MATLPNGLLDKVKFNLTNQDDFVKHRGIVFEHWAAVPSSIGLSDKGEYRRSEVSDTITSNGFIYTKVGEFTAVLVGNSHSKNEIDAGLFDNSVGRLILPRFYNARKPSNKKPISLLPGDRVYVKDLVLSVENYQKVNFNHAGLIDYLQFPATSVSFLVDSFGRQYQFGKDFKLDNNGNIVWDAKNNPGINPKTGKGNVYSIRYSYNAFWYVNQLINEIRITTDENNKPTRMPYSVSVQREYIYHNKNNTDPTNPQSSKTDNRTNEKPESKLSDGNYEVNVEVSNFK